MNTTNSLLAQLRQDLDSVFQRDPAARNRREVLLTYPGVHAIILHRLAHVMWRSGWSFAARLLAYFCRWLTNIDIHPGARIGARFFIDHGAGVVIGETAEIGDDVTLYHGVTLGGTSWSKGKRHPTLEDGVMVGAGAKILGPITIGARSRVGANSVVVSGVPADRTVVGIPGKVVQSSPRESSSLYGIDLDHHLIPDPVGKAIACLMDRLAILERDQLELTTRILRNARTHCPSCEAEQLCAQPASAPAGNPRMKKLIANAIPDQAASLSQ